MSLDSFIERVRAVESEAQLFLSHISTETALEEAHAKFLGRKGHLTLLLDELKTLPNTDKPVAGKELNIAKSKVEALFSEKQKSLETAKLLQSVQVDPIDVTLPPLKWGVGKLHPITQVENELIEIFESMGFDVEEGPHVEQSANNFDALNIPADHPARDMQDTFFIDESTWLLRTHTSPVQIHTMRKYAPPIKIIVPGAVYRHDADITHSPMFHQIEGLYVDEGVNFGHLKYTLEEFFKRLFGANARMRMRPSFFPFTEPSAEVDVSCVICSGQGCKVCKMSGWLEILGAGMVNPKVFDNVSGEYRDGYSKGLTGFAFGLGVERIAMLKFGIDDIRLFYENDDRFLRQF